MTRCRSYNHSREKVKTNSVLQNCRNGLFRSSQRELTGVGYICDDFLNKHKRMIVEFEAGFRLHWDFGGSLIHFLLFLFDASSSLSRAQSRGERISNHMVHGYEWIINVKVSRLCVIFFNDATLK